jgi:hypothetical protein
MVRVSSLAMHLEEHLAELDINPQMVLPPGQGVMAADALVVFRRTLALHVAESRTQKSARPIVGSSRPLLNRQPPLSPGGGNCS